MDKIKEKNASAYYWLKDNKPLEYWARIKFDEALKSNDNTNNFVKSFNNAIVKHMGKPVYSMLEEIRKIVGSRFNRRFQLAASWDGKVTPYVEKTLRMTEIEARNCSNAVALQGRVRYGSGTKRCKNCKELGHNSLTCGKLRDANGNLIQKYKMKPKQKKGDQDYCLTVILFLHLEHYILDTEAALHAYCDCSMRKKTLAISVP
ncbi:hypothetical protein Cgig2_018572 [Carnegiea gigantea]|uniref:Uncharacterized protein n=1 Tax=Carnegiea gigantea TaxID=171969 RepID=A0A9Q1KJM0_9CARY|nr:hypothetical protein Cgig2_018572 [Carnegiea gigantea]